MASRKSIGGMIAAVAFTLCVAAPVFASDEPMPSAETKAALKKWMQVQKEADVAFEANQFGKAERLYRDAVAQAREIGPGDIRIAKSPGELGRLLTVRRRFAEAEPYLEEEFYLKDRSIGHENGELISTMEDLIRFYLINGTVEKAEPLTEDLLAIVQRKYTEQSERTKEESKFKEGTPLVGWAGTATPDMHDPLLEWAITCDKLGELYFAKRKLKMADTLFKTGLDCKATVVGKKHLSLASSYEHLGEICLLKNELKDAESYFREALQISESILEPGDTRNYVPMDKLASCLIAEGKYAEAEQLYLRAAQTWRGCRRTDIEQRALFALGCMYANTKRYSAASATLHHALRIVERASGPYSVQLVPYLQKCAYVSYQTGHRGEWQNMQARARNIAPVPKQLQAIAKAIPLSIR